MYTNSMTASHQAILVLLSYNNYSILLLMRLCCKGCGHSGSEHRRLTAVDGMVREEVERAGNVRCSHLIPLNEIPTSPVFRSHDPIPIPYDSDLDQVYPMLLLKTCKNFRSFYCILAQDGWFACPFSHILAKSTNSFGLFPLSLHSSVML